MRILVLDLGIGNISNVVKAVDGVSSSDPKDVEYADKIILPGVGNFKEIAGKISHFRERILKFIESGGFFLGICLGLQLLFERSEEANGEGLKILEGDVVRLKGVRAPHIGWNRIILRRASPILHGIEDGSFFYFVHSYYVRPRDESIVVAVTDHGKNENTVVFPSIIQKGRIYGVQFHPEKSGEVGLKLLRNFRNLGEE